MSSSTRETPLGIYVHFPWCLEKCPYCDFLSVAVPRSASGAPASRQEATRWIPHQKYADAILLELEARLRQLPEPLPPLGSIFFGGGTPSLWQPRQIGQVVSRILDIFSPPEAPEITVECNPTSVDEEHFEGLLAAGVNRVSVGVQAVDDDRLAFLGRLHDQQGGLRALVQARRAGMPRVSADLIFGVHGQPPPAAVRDVHRVLETGVDHLSAYALTIEPGTRFGALDTQGKLPLLHESMVAESFERVSRALCEDGFSHYEVSNFARPGSESRHNIGYWKGYDYLGLGTGAYGTVTLPRHRLRYKNLLSPERYLDAYVGALEARAFDPFAENLSDREIIDSATSVSEAILLGLRLKAGIHPTRIERRFGSVFWTSERKGVGERLLATGRLQCEGDRLWIPRQHWLFADGIIRELL